MKIGIFSDIHSNLNALEVVINFYKEHPCDDYLCLGDVVGYGPQPDECCDLVKKFASVTIVGNHDAAVSGRMAYNYYYDAARNVLDYHARIITKENMKWLSELPYKKSFVVRQGEGGKARLEEAPGASEPDSDFTICHGSTINPEDFNYVFYLEQALQLLPSYEKLAPITFIGHSHLTKSFELTPHNATDITGNTLHFEEGKKYFVTVGSVGQPRDYDNRSCCTIYDTETRTLTYYRLAYDIEDTVKKLFDTEITCNFGKRLYLGI